MSLSEDIAPAIEIDIIGDEECDFSFLGEFSPTTDLPPNPRLVRLAGLIEKDFQGFSRVSRKEVEYVIQNSISLLGGSTSGLAACLPCTGKTRTEFRTVVINLAHFLSQFARETDAIGDERFDILNEIFSRIDHALMKAPLVTWPELQQIPTGNDSIFLGFHYDLCSEGIYGQVTPFWQRAIISKMRSGNLIAPSSMSAFLTPLRQFTRKFPFEDLPKNLFHLTPGDREVFAGRIKTFFDNPLVFSLSRRTREDYASTVILALMTDPESGSSKTWTWKYSSHVSRLDSDPPEEDGIDDGYTEELYLAAVRATAKSVGDLETLSFLQLGNRVSGDGSYELDSTTRGGRLEPITRQELARIHHYSSGRYAMASFHSPFSQSSLSVHVICTFDHWLSTQSKNKDCFIWALLFHLLLVTGRSLDWALSIQIGATKQDTESAIPFYDPQTCAITTDTMMKLNLPRMPAVDCVRSAYLPTTPCISIPLCAKAAGWIEKIHGKNLFEEGSLLLIHPDGSPITKNDVQDMLFHPFSEYMLSRQPGLPAMTLGKIRKAFWSLFTWQGLSPEDATMISDQYYLDVRAPMFYACRPLQHFQASYKTTYSAVVQSLFRIYKELFPQDTPLTFSPDSDPFHSPSPSNAIYYGSCYCPQPEKLQRLIAVIISSLSEDWQESEVHKQFDLLSYASAFGVSLGLGLRVGEVAGLTYQSVDHQAGTIAVNGKSDRFFEEMRILPIPTPIREPLLQLTACRDRLGISKEALSPFFHIFQGRASPVPLSRERLWRQLRLWEKKAGLEEAIFRWHAFRHAMALYVLQDGSLTFPERSYFLGHVAGQQWLEELRPGEQQIVFDKFNSIVSRMMTGLSFDLSAFLQIDDRGL
jgi:integrase